MLRLAKVPQGGDAYYFRTVLATTDRPDGLIEADPYWLGAGASALGLSGDATQSQVRALFDGADPLTGEILPEGHGGRVTNVAYDLTLSTPKSVSLVHALASPEATARIQLAHDSAVEATLGWVEREALCARRSAAPERWEIPVQGAVAVGFVHRTSRANDPHLHTHVLVANLACGEDGRWTALDARGLYQLQRPARALFETHLRGELTRIGVQFGPLRKCYADISAITRETVRAFSQRSQVISETMRAEGLHGPAAASLVAAITRPAKDREHPYAELQEAWTKLGHRMAISATRIERAAGMGVEPRVAPASAPDFDWVETVADPLDGTFTYADLIVARCMAAPAGATIDEITADVRRAIESGAVLRDGASASPSARRGAGPGPRTAASAGHRERFTTPAQQVRVAEASERLRQLGRDAGAAILAYDDSGGRVPALNELARLASQAAERGSRVVGVAPGDKAARGFEAVSGIETFGVKRAAALEGRLSVGDVVILADCGVLEEKELQAILLLCRDAGARPVLVGASASMDRSGLLEGLRAGALEVGARVAPAVAAPVPEIRPARVTSALAPPGAEGGPRLLPTERRLGPMATVSFVPDVSAAQADLAARAHEMAAAGREVMIVVPDRAVVGDVRSAIEGSGLITVHEPRGAAAALTKRMEQIEAGKPLPAVIVMGGAAPLAMSAERLRQIDRTHVLVSPDGAADLGTAAEAARPAHLTQELGAVRSDPAGRAAWREGARLIEQFRDRHDLTADKRAYGGRERSSGVSEPDGGRERSSGQDRGREAEPGVPEPALGAQRHPERGPAAGSEREPEPERERKPEPERERDEALVRRRVAEVAPRRGAARTVATPELGVARTGSDRGLGR